MRGAGTVERSALARLLAPRSVGIAGVSASGGSLGGMVLENLERFGFVGDIHLIHPRQVALQGRPCVSGPEHLPLNVDCVVLAIPAGAVVAAVRACAARGVGGVVVFAAGFAELGDQGRAMQDEIAAIADAAGMAVEGPNCLGFVNDVDGVAITFAATRPRPVQGRAIAVVSQSGAMTTVVRAALHGRDLPVSIAVSTGNEACCGLEDVCGHVLAAAETGVIAIVAEHIRAPPRFLAAARAAAARGVAVVMLHPGRSAAAQDSARTHTGAMTGDDAVMRVQVTRAGVLLADTLEELIDLCECLWRCACPPAAGRAGIGAAVLCESGAFKALALDYAQSVGLALPEPTEAAAAALDAISPGFIVASNPLDLTAQALGDPGLYGRAIGLLLDNPDCAYLLVCVILTSAEMAARKMPPVIAALRQVAPMRTTLFAMLGEDTPIPDAIQAELRAIGVPFFRSPERGMRVLARLKEGQGRRPWTPLGAAPPDPHLLECAALDGVAHTLCEHAGKGVLARVGLRVPRGVLALDRAEAVAAAAGLGEAVVLKAQVAGLAHKSDVGGVVLNLRGAAAVGAGFDRLVRDVTAAGLVVEGVLVEEMSAPGLEMIVGARRDAGWGAVVTVGLGGVTAEALGDVRVLAAECAHGEVMAELGRLRGAALLGPFRGRAARDVAALAAAVVSVGELMQARLDIAEMDINPLMVFAAGDGVMALDAVIACR